MMAGKLRSNYGRILTATSLFIAEAAFTFRKQSSALLYVDRSGDWSMVSKPSNNTLVALCLVLSAALFFFGTGLAPVWCLTWLAPIPVLWLAPRMSASAAFLVAAGAFALGGLNEWYYLTTVIPIWLSIINA